MPQMFPMSWIFLWVYVFLGLFFMIVVLSYIYVFSVINLVDQKINNDCDWKW